MRKLINIVAFILLSFNIIEAKSASSDSVCFKGKGILIIPRKNVLYESTIRGEFLFTNKALIFYPKQNVHYMKNVVIALDNINKVKTRHVPLLMPTLKIKTNEGREHMLILLKNRKLIKSKIDSIIAKRSNIVVPKEDSSSNVYNCNTNEYKVGIWINSFGSIFYTPLLIEGCIEKNENTIIFKPKEYIEYIKTIEINRNEIKAIRKKSTHKVIIELNNGNRFTFKASNRLRLIADLTAK